MTTFAIVNARGEFYADPVYTDKRKALKKIEYLHAYQIEHNMTSRESYRLEILTPEREAQHAEEWNRFVAAL